MNRASVFEWYKRFKESICYITYDMDFQFVPSDPSALSSCHVVISKQGDGSRRGSQVQ